MKKQRQGYTIIGGIGGLGYQSTWVCGPARVEGDWVILDQSRAKPYIALPDGKLGIAAELAHLSNPIQPEEAIEFVGKFGLLTEFEPDNLRENFREWQPWVDCFRDLL